MWIWLLITMHGTNVACTMVQYNKQQRSYGDSFLCLFICYSRTNSSCGDSSGVTSFLGQGCMNIKYFEEVRTKKKVINFHFEIWFISINKIISYRCVICYENKFTLNIFFLTKLLREEGRRRPIHWLRYWALLLKQYSASL